MERFHGIYQKISTTSRRINIVVSKTLREIDVANEVILVRSLREALELAKGFHKHIWLIGGYRIFKEGMMYADSIYITEVCVDVLKPGMTTYLQNPIVKDLTMMCLTSYQGIQMQ